MKTGLEGRAVLITGAGRNIGRRMSVMFAEEGANLAICTSRNMDGLDATAAEAEKAGAKVIAQQVDVTDPEAVAAVGLIMLSQGNLAEAEKYLKRSVAQE